MKKSLLAALIATAFCISARVDAADAAAYIATVRGGPSDLTLSVSLFPDPALTGLQGNIYVAALIGDNWYFKTPAGWKRWESNTPRPVFVRATLNPQDLSIFNSERVASETTPPTVFSMKPVTNEATGTLDAAVTRNGRIRHTPR